MTKNMKLYYDSARGRRERFRNRRTTIFRKAHELEAKCNAQVLILIQTSSKRYLYKSEEIDRVVEGATLSDVVEKSWPPCQVTTATDFATIAPSSSPTPDETSESDREDEEQTPASTLPWDIKIVPSPPNILVSPTVVRPDVQI